MKIGICTLYFENSNYGANLQAYALCHICETLGYDAEQICYYDSYRIKKFISLSYRAILGKKYYKSNDFYVRKMAIKKFRDSIPHSKIYYKTTLKKANTKYDAFIVGSDQVWNPSWILPAYTLEFAKQDKLKISYAASMGREKLDDSQQEIFKDILSRMTSISVREKSGVEILEKLTDKRIEWVLDPTLLLSEDEWNQVASDRIVNEDYVFCYYLGENENYRRIAKEYANRHGYKIITLPYLSYQYRKADEGFGDYKLYDVSPSDFISLVKFSRFVFTDSFHASVFSHLYKKEFVVFSPEGKQSKVRMDSLTEMFNTQERHLIGNDFSANSIEHFQPIDYSNNETEYLNQKKKSIEFLKNSLEVSRTVDERNM